MNFLIPSARMAFKYYPHAYVLPDGRIFVAGQDDKAISSKVLDLNTQTWATVDTRVLDGHSSVMYEPGKVMKAGTATGQQLACGESTGLPDSVSSLRFDTASRAQGCRMGLSGAATAAVGCFPVTRNSSLETCGRVGSCITGPGPLDAKRLNGGVRQKAQMVDNDDGVVLDHSVEQGNPPDAPQLAPAVVRVKKRAGRTSGTVTADRG